jgi:septum formation topological specificity factor MinE
MKRIKTKILEIIIRKYVKIPQEKLNISFSRSSGPVILIYNKKNLRVDKYILQNLKI